MKKKRTYWLNPGKTFLMCQVYINGKLAITFSRDLSHYVVNSCCVASLDITTFDLEMHAFLRMSHQYIIDKDSITEKVEDMFELDNPNLF